MVETRTERDRKPQVFAIQYLRAIAALMVVFHHAIIPQLWLFNPLGGVDFGARGVDIFFVISGFVMFTAARNEPILTFYFRRIIRVVPLYWSATIASIVVHIFLTGDGVSRLNIIKSFLFIPFYNPTHGVSSGRCSCRVGPSTTRCSSTCYSASRSSCANRSPSPAPRYWRSSQPAS